MRLVNYQLEQEANYKLCNLSRGLSQLYSFPSPVKFPNCQTDEPEIRNGNDKKRIFNLAKNTTLITKLEVCRFERGKLFSSRNEVSAIVVISLNLFDRSQLWPGCGGEFPAKNSPGLLSYLSLHRTHARSGYLE